MTQGIERARRVLVVDDEAPLRELIVVTLGEAFDCEEAADGETALAQLARQPPDLVFLDVMLPGLSGIDVLRKMRADPALARRGGGRRLRVAAAAGHRRALESGRRRFLRSPSASTSWRRSHAAWSGGGG